MQKFDKVTLDKIEQGDFFAAAESAFQDVCVGLITHIKQYGKDAEANLGLKVKIAHKNGAYVITTDIVKALPKKPSGITTALAEQDGDGSLCLFAQSGGTHAGDPKQLTLCRDNGGELPDN